MTLEELAEWMDTRVPTDSTFHTCVDRENRAAAAACRELADKRANITGYKGKSDTRAELEAETDRLLRECK